MNNKICPKCNQNQPNVGPWNEPDSNYKELCGPCKIEEAVSKPGFKEKIANSLGIEPSKVTILMSRTHKRKICEIIEFLSKKYGLTFEEDRNTLLKDRKFYIVKTQTNQHIGRIQIQFHSEIFGWLINPGFLFIDDQE